MLKLLFGIRLIRLHQNIPMIVRIRSKIPSSSVLNVDISNSRTVVGKKETITSKPSFCWFTQYVREEKMVPMPSKFHKSCAVVQEHSICVRKLFGGLDTNLNEQKEGYLETRLASLDYSFQSFFDGYLHYYSIDVRIIMIV